VAETPQGKQTVTAGVHVLLQCSPAQYDALCKAMPNHRKP
jgi:hypothetical protein